MNGMEAVIAGAIQGTIEWLPISSEAQTMLYLLNSLHMNPQTALSYAFYLHFGTMIAVIIRFREEFIQILRNLRLDYKPTRIILIASLSTAVTALPLYFLLKSISPGQNSSTFTLLIGGMLILTGIIMKASGTSGKKEMDQMTDKDTIITGLAQGFAILPGISRSGITMAALLAQKINQETALVISFLMSVPAALSIFLIDFGTIRLIPLQTAFILTVSSLFFGYISMNVLLKIAKRTPFWIFCIILGAVTILFVLLL
ncbi:undecaprenyl-diphosphate phosphatase [Methanogenium sp. S4BF]|uniref:undecaprenyl-diphosphate phosphatase n=1 Tax=Methanogenium sp. S4BF TaxID=1789226 RepID=UPI0024179FF7|nr:undecaprenyl-diphosphate phosphatase [Methanogenium sp. S4BF]WFN35112.1 undecaprenyl-diphosphate phosphatase [Methanogenium sp. S4BF]